MISEAHIATNAEIDAAVMDFVLAVREAPTAEIAAKVLGTWRWEDDVKNMNQEAAEIRSASSPTK